MSIHIVIVFIQLCVSFYFETNFKFVAYKNNFTNNFDEII